MKWIGVITGDIVGSSEILKAGERDKLLEVMKETVEELNNNQDFGNIKMEIYRGDSFQIVTKSAYIALEIALLFRANLIANSSKNSRWDARIGIGIGIGEYIVKSTKESDGEAFHLSGIAFDYLGKSKYLEITTPNDDFNKELMVSTAFADDIISNWTPTQASVFYIRATSNLNQKEMAQKVDKSPQAISKIHTAGKNNLILAYMLRYIQKTIALTIKNPPSHDHP